MLEKLRCKGVPGYIVSWVQGFLMGRRSILGLGEAEVEISPECGVPQGSPLSPPLFLVFTHDLLWILGRIRELGIQAFADDLSAWASGDLWDGQTHRGLCVVLWAVSGWASFLASGILSGESVRRSSFVASRLEDSEAFRGMRLGSELIPHTRVLHYLGV